jgi:hypothetical protein
MDWKTVGDWLSNNAGTGAALVGSLLTGNIPGAVAAGVSLVTGATGEGLPDKALSALQTDPGTMLKLRELAVQNDASIREHIRAMEELRLKDLQAEQEETGKTVRSGDNAEDRLVRWTRPLQAWVGLAAGIAYVFTRPVPDITILGILLALPWAYSGLRQIGKGIDSFTTRPKA